MTEQERNLQIVKGVALAAAVTLGVALLLLYYGYELPFYDMRRQHTDATGYAPPPSLGAVTGAGVPRMTGVALTHRVELTPSLPFPPELKRIPATPASLRNPVAGRASAVTRGRALYEVNCAMCHGRNGDGEGPVGRSYVPAPPDLRDYAPGESTETVYVVMTYGIRSTPVPSARILPYQWHAYRDILTQRERWEIATFIKTVFGGGP